MAGIRAWKVPKYRAMMTACFWLKCFEDKPLQMATAKASIDKPMARKSSSNGDIGKPPDV